MAAGSWSSCFVFRRKKEIRVASDSIDNIGCVRLNETLNIQFVLECLLFIERRIVIVRLWHTRLGSRRWRTVAHGILIWSAVRDSVEKVSVVGVVHSTYSHLYVYFSSFRPDLSQMKSSMHTTACSDWVKMDPLAKVTNLFSISEELTHNLR